MTAIFDPGASCSGTAEPNDFNPDAPVDLAASTSGEEPPFAISPPPAPPIAPPGGRDALHEQRRERLTSSELQDAAEADDRFGD